MLDCLKSLDPTKGAGPDRIPSHIVIQIAPYIALPLTMIFNQSIQTDQVPEFCKESNVIPIHKKDKKDDVKNYRPISLCNTFSKVFERIISSQIYSYMEKLFINSQHGFIKNRSCITNLLLIQDYISEVLERRSQVMFAI